MGDRVTLAVVASRVEDMREDIGSLREDLKSLRAELLQIHKEQKDEMWMILSKHQEALDALRESDRRWAGVAMVLSAIGSVIAAIFGLSK